MSKVKLKGKLFERKGCDKCIRPLNVLICLTQPFLLNELYIFHYNQWEREDPTATQKEWMYIRCGSCTRCTVSPCRALNSILTL